MNKKTKKLNKANNQLDKLIKKENQEDFTNMICYLRGANISEYDQELVRQDLTEMVLSAQDRGESIETVIGEDYKLFCDHVISSLPPKTKKQKMVDTFDLISFLVSILTFYAIISSRDSIMLLRDAFAGNALNFDIAISIGTVITNGLIAVGSIVIVEMVVKNAFQPQNSKYRILKSFMIGVGVFGIMLLIAWFGKATLFTVNLWIAFSVAACFFGVHKVLEQV